MTSSFFFTDIQYTDSRSGQYVCGNLDAGQLSRVLSNMGGDGGEFRYRMARTVMSSTVNFSRVSQAGEHPCTTSASSAVRGAVAAGFRASSIVVLPELFTRVTVHLALILLLAMGLLVIEAAPGAAGVTWRTD
jgi:hypothetical protein